MTVMTFMTAQARLFMCYVATHPEKLDESRADQWRKVRCPPTMHLQGSEQGRSCNVRTLEGGRGRAGRQVGASTQRVRRAKRATRPANPAGDMLKPTDRRVLGRTGARERAYRPEDATACI